MENRKKVRRGAVSAKQPGTKLYRPHIDESAYAYDPETGEKRTEPVFTSAPMETKTRSELRPAARVTLIICAFIFAGMLLFTLSGYEKIARTYSSINELEDSIDDIKLRINALEAEIECAVTIEQATAYATSHGMQYPLRTQYKYIGSSENLQGIGSSGAVSADGPSGTFPEAEAAGETSTPSSEPADEEPLDLLVVEVPQG